MPVQHPQYFKCKEVPSCTGTQKAFANQVKYGITTTQFKCDICHSYVKVIDGNFHSRGKYNQSDIKGNTK